MFAKIVSDKLLKLAYNASDSGEFAKAQRAFSQARFWGGVTQIGALAVDTDAIGVVYAAPTKEQAHKLALNATWTY